MERHAFQLGILPLLVRWHVSVATVLSATCLMAHPNVYNVLPTVITAIMIQHQAPLNAYQMAVHVVTL